MPADRPPRLAVATCALAPGLDQDGPLLRRALADLGVAHVVHQWDDPDVDWSAFETVLVRSTWDYPGRRDEFLTWVGSCRSTANPAAVLGWNTDKTYLRDLAAVGVPVVPTVYVAPGSAVEAPWTDVVVKPAVGGSAADTGRFAAAASPDAQDLVRSLHARGRTAMLQPYLPGIDAGGETSLVFLGGTLSHAVRREPLLRQQGARDPVSVADVLASVRAVEPTAAQRSVAEAAVDAVPGGRGSLAYARVDLIPGDDDPVLLELEATDCFLFLAFADNAARRRMVATALGAGLTR